MGLEKMTNPDYLKRESKQLNTSHPRTQSCCSFNPSACHFISFLSFSFLFSYCSPVDRYCPYNLYLPLAHVCSEYYNSWFLVMRLMCLFVTKQPRTRTRTTLVWRHFLKQQQLEWVMASCFELLYQFYLPQCSGIGIWRSVQQCRIVPLCVLPPHPRDVIWKEGNKKLHTPT